MNPILLLYLLIGAFLLWVLIAWLFPKIGDFVKNIFDDVKNVIEEEENEDE